MGPVAKENIKEMGRAQGAADRVSFCKQKERIAGSQATKVNSFTGVPAGEIEGKSLAFLGWIPLWMVWGMSWGSKAPSQLLKPD